MKRKITEEMLLKWTGSDHTKEELIDVLLSVANGEYAPELLYADIFDYADEEDNQP
jgi:hypothetical protein